MKKKFKIFLSWTFNEKKIFFSCLYLAIFFKFLKKITSLEKIFSYSKKPLIFFKPAFSEKKLLETNEIINKISRNLINISCLLRVLILKKYFANSKSLKINIGIRSKNEIFESHAWINHEAYLKLENDELMSFKKLYEYR